MCACLQNGASYSRDPYLGGIAFRAVRESLVLRLKIAPIHARKMGVCVVHWRKCHVVATWYCEMLDIV